VIPYFLKTFVDEHLQAKQPGTFLVLAWYFFYFNSIAIAQQAVA
jgi:hypothetical protein